ncbi:MAG: signal peptide peptidase SppA [Alphaproteobacteria bacterium]|nr:signal peptide peptidase SppA [Alphaproteobacteria bacterium]
MRRFIVGLLAVIGVVTLLGVLGSVGLVIWDRVSGPHVPEVTVLTLDVDGNLPDAPQTGGLLGLLAPHETSLRDVLGALDKSGRDPRVKGLLLRIGGGDLALAQVQELRDAIAAFRAKGKVAFAYSDSFGEFASGTRAYYLASACDQIWLQPLGLVGLVGLRAEEPYFRGTLDKLGLVPRFDQREQYKTALNLLTQTKMTDPEREQLQSLLGSLLDQIVAGIADGRKLAPDRVRDLIANGPYLAQDALSAHLVDHLGYVGDALDALKARAGAGAKAMRVARYLDSVGRPHDTGPVMALIYADGLMTRGKSDSGALFGTGVMGSDSVIHAFRLAERDKNVRAILFRIDSPGGSAVAAESIWDEVKKARAAGKPVIVSMGDVAGSGGYYIAASADKIVAEPATLTGSIGVVAGKVLIGGLMDKIGAGADAVQTSDNAALFSPLQDFTAEGYKQFEAALDSTYAGFKARVAEGRHMKPDQIESVAKGRIWTGAQAKANDLVDALGGYETAIALAKAEIGVPASGDITLRVYPRPESGLVVLLHRLLGTSREDPLAILPSIAGFMRELAMLSVRPGMLVMPPIEIR